VNHRASPGEREAGSNARAFLGDKGVESNDGHSDAQRLTRRMTAALITVERVPDELFAADIDRVSNVR
jgi:hypothetical protein